MNSTRHAALFSTPLEVGLRALFVLVHQPAPVDLQELTVYDYLLLHSADADGPPSLHPATPHRSGELLVRRKVLREGLELMIARGLIEVHLGDEGIAYSALPVTRAFLDYLDNEYASGLRSRADWIATQFSGWSKSQLQDYVREHLDEWGGEFASESVVRGGVE